MSTAQTAQRFPYTEMTGSWREIGRQHGEEYRESIHWLLDRVMRKALALHGSREAVLDWCLDHGEAIRSRWPRWQSELDGLAEGANLSAGECLALQLRPGNGELIRRDEGCTSFVIAGDSTASGEPLVGQTRDIDTSLQEHMFVGLFRPDDGPSILAHCVPGEIGGVGLNSNGVAICANSLHAKRARSAWIGAPLIRRVELEAADVDDALQRVRDLPCLPYGNELFMDVRGHFVNIEIVGPEVAVTHRSEGIYVHTNDCLADNTRAEEDYPDIACSQGRRARMIDLLEKDAGRIRVETCQAALSDTAGRPEPISRTPTAENSLSTVAGMVMEPVGRSLHVSYGPPSEGEFTQYTIP